jgi:hypothetical protein
MPALDDLIDLWSSLLSNLGNSRVAWRIEWLKALFLDTGLQQLLVTLYFSRASLSLL